MKKLHKLGITIACAIPAAAALGVTAGVVASKAIERKMVDMKDGYEPKVEAAETSFVDELAAKNNLTRYYFTGSAPEQTNGSTTIDPYNVIKDDLYTYLGFYTKVTEFYVYLQNLYPQYFQDLGAMGDVLKASANLSNLEIKYESDTDTARLSGQIRLDTEFKLVHREVSEDGTVIITDLGKCHVYLDYVLKDMPYHIISGSNGYASWIKSSSLATDQLWKLGLTFKFHTELIDMPEIPDVEVEKSYDYNDGEWDQSETKPFCWTSYHLTGKYWEKE